MSLNCFSRWMDGLIPLSLYIYNLVMHISAYIHTYIGLQIIALLNDIDDPRYIVKKKVYTTF